MTAHSREEYVILKSARVNYDKDYSTGKITEECSGATVDSLYGTIRLHFTETRNGKAFKYLSVSLDDLRTLLRAYAQHCPDSASLFSECVSLAIAADNERMNELISHPAFKKVIDMSDEVSDVTPDSEWFCRLRRCFSFRCPTLPKFWYW